ncbi:MAG: hypothetical protein PHT07_23510 [Paludibacter sp.]|nr:hypothetical protein [Paludibacter sp.]
MKKFIFITLALLAMLSISCSDELSNTTTPTVTVWRSSTITDTTLSAAFDYYEFRFTSPSTLELWVKRTASESPEKVDQTYSYSIKDKIITIVYNDLTSIGTIDNSKMTITENGSTMVFVKR